MKIRRATIKDAKPISALIASLTQFFTLHPQGRGAGNFLQDTEPAAIEGYIAAANFNYFVALEGQRLAGVVAMRDNTHLYHLFVGQEFQARGLGRELWQHATAAAISAGNHQGFTVNATPYAVT